MTNIMKYGIIGLVVTFIIVGVASYITNANYGHKAETEIEAVYQNNQNILSQYSQKVMEAAQVPTMMKDDVKELMQAAMTGRYGNNGSTAVMQWIKEQNLSVDPALYIKIQQIVEGGRNEFQVAQTRLIDVKRVYETNLGYVWKGFWLKMAGYPKKNLADFKVITTTQTDAIFEAGKETQPMKLR